jgi:peptide chain release factor 1
LTLYKLADVMNGDIDPVIQPLQQEYQAELLASITE